MIAVPIRWGDAVIGILEVFSPEPYAFSTNDPLALKRLAEIISTAVHRAGVPEPGLADHYFAENKSAENSSSEGSSRESGSVKPISASVAAASIDDEFPVETSADLPLPHFSRSRKILLFAAAATIVFAASWLIPARDLVNFTRSTSASTASPPEKVLASPPTPTAVAGGGLEGMRKLPLQGDATAQFSVGARYATGEEVPQDYSEAVRWFSMAAEQGHIAAQATLGEYYRLGRGVPEDLVKAYFWSVLAQAGGDEASKYRVALLASQMSGAQIAAAQQQANDWIKEHASPTPR
jgi:TPR repeat protein